MISFSDFNIWSCILIIGILFASMILAHALKNNIGFLKKSLIPASVLGGCIILLFTSIFQAVSDKQFFQLEVFSAGTISGSTFLEALTYHCLSLGFICMAFRSSAKENQKKRTTDIVNTGVTTVATYLLQVLLGIGIVFIFSKFIPALLPGVGTLLAFGYGQGTGQALNFGRIYEESGFVGGANFGLAIAALGFLSASIGGVIVMNILRAKKKLVNRETKDENPDVSLFQGNNEVSLNASIDKLTIQIALIIIAYVAAYGIMYLLGNVVGDGLKSTIYGFNFIFGSLTAILIKFVLNFLRKKNIIKKDYINDFMMNRLGGVAFDTMIVAGIAAITLDTLKTYWLVLLVMGLIGAIATYAFNMVVAKALFKDYKYEQFFAMYGMLTGTASTGVILLREIDPNFETPASKNLVYQNFPAILLGFPMMIFAKMAIEKPLLVSIIVAGYLIVLLVFLFRTKIFKKKKNNK